MCENLIFFFLSVVSTYQLYDTTTTNHMLLTPPPPNLVVLPCRRERLKEMAAMKVARERQLEEEERYESSYYLT